MRGLGCLCSVAAAGFGVVAALPLLGWLNWITTLPLAILAIAFSGLALSRGDRSVVAAGSLGLGVLTLCWALFRLAIGGGLV